MSTAAFIIDQAYRENNILPISPDGVVPVANPAQQIEALSRLNRFCRSLIGTIYGENMLDWEIPSPQRTAPVAANYPQLPFPSGLDAYSLSQPIATDSTINIWPYPPSNSRIVFGGTTSQHAYLSESPIDGARIGVLCGGGAVPATVLTIDPNGRTINGALTLLLTAPFAPQEWVYRADLGDWRPSLDIILTDQMPYSPDMDDLFITGLALRLAPAYGKVLAPETSLIFKNAVSAFRARYRQAASTVYGSQDFPRSLQSFLSGRWFW